MYENQIQKTIINYLQLLENTGKLYFIRNNSFSGYIQQRNGYRSFVKNSKRGTPDIIISINGKYLALEVKTLKGRQSPEQKRAEEQIVNTGGFYYIVKSVDDVENIIRTIFNS